MNKKLYILPFDHRSSFAKMFGLNYKHLTEEEWATLMDYRHIIYEGFLLALQKGVQKSNVAILTDEEFGSPVLAEAKRDGITRILTVEKSGSNELALEYGDNFKGHIEKFAPEYAKILLYYNPDEKERNARQLQKSKLVYDFCKEKRYKFLIELLIRKGTLKKTRAELVRESIKEFQEQGIEPDIWKLEGLESDEAMKKIVKQVKEGQKNDASVVILGRGEDKEKVEEWLRVGASVKGVIGFAVGRTVFQEPLIQYHKKEISRGECANTIAKNFIHFINVFENTKQKVKTQNF